MPTVSVIIPSYNHENYVRESIQSVLDQTFQDFEIVITDDGSSDRTVEIIESFNDSRIKLFRHLQNKGACVAANNCIQHAAGKYIAMQSSDDVWYPEKLEIQVQYLEKHPEIAAVFGKVDWIDENGIFITNKLFPFRDLFDVENRSRFEWLRYFFLKGNCLCHPSSLVRKECYSVTGMLKPAFANIPDLDLWIRLCMKYDITILDRKLIKYRWIGSETNASGDSIKNIIRIRHEYRFSLNNYLQITSPNELLKIFPEASQYGEVTRENIPYFLGRIAIDDAVDFRVLWGLDTICSLLQDKEIAQILETKCNFTYLSFIKLSGEKDPLKITPPFLAPAPLKQESLRVYLSASKRYLKAFLTTANQLFRNMK